MRRLDESSCWLVELGIEVKDSAAGTDFFVA